MKKVISLLIVLMLSMSQPLSAFASDISEDQPEVADSPETAMPVDAEVMEEKPASIFDLLENSNVSYEIDLTTYYLELMAEAAEDGDTEAGHTAEKNRNDIIDKNGSGEKISFDDLYLLSRLIQAEAGSDWLSQDFRICVGEVVLNRVASPEFPDNIYDVIYEKGQYSCTSLAGFTTLIPSADCVDAALRLLKGERLMVPSVVFHAGFVQGEVFSMHKDTKLGITFFCVSNNLELYPIE